MFETFGRTVNMTCFSLTCLRVYFPPGKHDFFVQAVNFAWVDFIRSLMYNAYNAEILPNFKV